MDEPIDLRLTEAEKRKIWEDMSREMPPEARSRLMGTPENPGLASMLIDHPVTRNRYKGFADFQGPVLGAAIVRQIPERTRDVLDAHELRSCAATESVESWLKDESDRGLGLLLHGEASGGKTLHACAVVYGRVFKTLERAEFVSESMLVQRLQPFASDERDRRLRPYKNAKVLIVDYMGRSKSWAVKSWSGGVIEFLRLRWEEGRNRNILTFRGSPEQFARTYGRNAWQTIERFCTVVEVQNPRSEPT